MDLACLLTRNSQGGPAKVAIFASALFGTISGSAAANVYGTGTFTIPLMKKVGYRAPFAGAVEAVASTGGQLMPPVMGTAAFLMADLSGAGYLNVAKAALLPAILYYLALLVMIHFEAVKNDLGKLSPDMVPETQVRGQPPLLPRAHRRADPAARHGPERGLLRQHRHAEHRPARHAQGRDPFHLQILH